MSNLRRTRLVLLGGGHAHVQVLRRLAMQPEPDLEVVLIADGGQAVYSGMVPGLIAGDYSADDLTIDLLPLARMARAKPILARASSIEPGAKAVCFLDRPAIRFDWLSINVGASVAGAELPGVQEYALPTRPIATLVSLIEERLAALRGRANTARVVVVGAGAGGVELAFTVQQRLARERELASEVRLVSAGNPNLPERLTPRVVGLLRERGIELSLGERVERVESHSLQTDTAKYPFELLIWAAGAKAPAWLAGTGLQTDEGGYLLTNEYLQCVGQERIFAAGDCAQPSAHPGLPRAGIHSVRQGKVLAHNLLRAVHQEPLARYRAQKERLILINLGGGRAIGAKWGAVFEGQQVFRWKDRIDRRFISKFQVLDSEGRVRPEFAWMSDNDEMADAPCGGCAAKLSQTDLELALDEAFRVKAKGAAPAHEPDPQNSLHERDDAALVSLAGLRVVTSCDSFPAFAEDPFLVGQVAAHNALSDVLVKGGEPRCALALVQLPRALEAPRQRELLAHALSGACQVFAAHDTELVSGHTTVGENLSLGFSVTGIAGERLLPLSALAPGDALVLTKSLGTGILLRAEMLGRCRAPWYEAMVSDMLCSHRAALELALSFGVQAATDITGFGLLGHVSEMARASSCGATIWLDELPALRGVSSCLKANIVSTARDQNRAALGQATIAPECEGHAELELLFDPQTAGPWLFAVPADQALPFQRALAEKYPAARVIGHAHSAHAGEKAVAVEWRGKKHR